MIYTKIKSKDLGIELKVTIDPNELYCTCCECGNEIHLSEDFIEFITKGGDFLTLFETANACCKCSKELMKMEEYKNDK